MSEWPSSAYSLRPPNFELEAVDGLTANEEVEDLWLELVPEGTVAPRAPTVASPWVLSPNNVAVAATFVVDILGVDVDAVGKQDEEGDKAIMATKLLSSQLSPSSCTAMLAPLVSSPGVPLLTAPPKSPFRAPPQLEDRAGLPARSLHGAGDDPVAHINAVPHGWSAKALGVQAGPTSRRVMRQLLPA